MAKLELIEWLEERDKIDQFQLCYYRRGGYFSLFYLP
jgi:hypothetical protein